MQPITKIKTERLQLRLSADIEITAMVSNPCMCFNDLKNYHNAISPKYMHVRVWNPSRLTINAKVTLKYYSLSRSPGTWKTFTRNITIDPNSKKTAIFWSNTYYDIISIKNTRKVEAKVEILNTNVTDPNMGNNTFVSQRCEYYVE